MNYYNYVWFLPVLILRFFLSNLFDYWFPYCIHLYIWSTQQVTVAQHMCWFFKTSNSPMFFSINHFNFIPWGQMVSFFFPFMVCYIRLFNFPSYCYFSMFFYPHFQCAACLAFVYFTTTVRDGVHTSSWSCWILLVARHRRDTFGVLSLLWILSWCHMDYIFFESFRLGLWRRADRLSWVFRYRPLSSYPGFLDSMLCALGSCCDGDCVLN